MNTYIVLNKQEFQIGEYSLVPIRMEDRYDIMKWRNEQIYHLRQNKPLTREDQDRYFNTVVKQLFETEKPDQLLFSYLEGDVCIGYGGLVHINWIDKNAEVSFIMDTTLEQNNFHKHWGIFLDLLEQIAFDELMLHKIYTYAFDLRPHLYQVIELRGFIKEAVFREHFFKNNEFKDVIVHSKINEGITIRKVSIEDKEITFKWANDIQTRTNSFNTNIIPYENHSKWFDNKLLDKNSWYYIGEIDGEALGLIRFDLKENKIVAGITIDKKYRGHRLSSKLLQKSCNLLSQHTDLNIVAYIKKDNIPSIKAFERAGFIYQTSLVINDIDSYEYIFKK